MHSNSRTTCLGRSILSRSNLAIWIVATWEHLVANVKFRVYILDFLVLSMTGVMVAPLVTFACLIGMIALPQFTSNSSEIRHWFLNRGFSVDFATGHLTFFAGQIPTILTLAILAMVLFAIRTRIGDQVAVVTLASMPFVEAFQVSSFSTVFNTPNLGMMFLKTQVLTSAALAAIIVAYVIARYRWPNPPPTMARSLFCFLLLGFFFVSSIALYLQMT